MLSFKWTDVSRHSPGAPGQEPRTVTVQVEDVTLIVTRHIRHAPTAWVLFFPPFFEGVEISHGALDDAKAAAIDLVRAKMQRLLTALPEN